MVVHECIGSSVVVGGVSSVLFGRSVEKGFIFASLVADPQSRVSINSYAAFRWFLCKKNLFGDHRDIVNDRLNDLRWSFLAIIMWTDHYSHLVIASIN